MANENEVSRVKILALYKILYMYTDEEHPLPADGLCEKLGGYGIKCERKTIYRDIAALKGFGADILYSHAQKGGYFIGWRGFEPPEVRLLTDAVDAAPFITNKKTAELTAKLQSLLSVWQAKEAKSRAHSENPLKHDNEEIYYAIYTIDRAIAGGRKISFTYHHSVIKGNKPALDAGRKFVISPYALIWNSDKYYLAGNYQKYDSVSVYRIDRMRRTELLCEPARRFEEVSCYRGRFDAEDFARRTFYMYSGEKRHIELRCKDSTAETMLDRFGGGVRISRAQGGCFTVRGNVYVSEGLIEWLMQYGGRVEVVSPPELRLEVINRVKELNAVYGVK